MASSFWASYTTILSLQVTRVKQLLGIHSEPQKVDHQVPPDLIGFQQMAKSTGQQGPQTGTGNEKISGSESKSPETVSTKAPSTVTTRDTSKVFPPLPPIPQPGGDMSSALVAFKRTLAKTWQSPSTPPERGTLMISGLVELTGKQAICLLDVVAMYHPKDSRWVSVTFGVRRLGKRRQTPLGSG